jgi:ribonuclease P protein component
MLKSAYRMRKNRSFRHVYRRGRSATTPLLTLVYVRTGPPNGLLIGFSVGKKVGKSVIRNRVKRQMRENCRLLLPQIRKGYWIVFVARSAASDAGFHRIGKDMASLLARARLMDPGSNP